MYWNKFQNFNLVMHRMSIENASKTIKITSNLVSKCIKFCRTLCESNIYFELWLLSKMYRNFDVQIHFRYYIDSFSILSLVRCFLNTYREIWHKLSFCTIFLQFFYLFYFKCPPWSLLQRSTTLKGCHRRKLL